LLKCTLESLRDQLTEDLFDYSIVIADNDREESARATVKEFANIAGIEVVYCVEPEQNISLARNKAIRSAKGDLIAWIDDDEYPEKDWLLNFFKTLLAHKTDGVLGPVKPVFETPPPDWIIKGAFFEKPRRKTGLYLRWQQTSTANVIVRRSILDGIDEPFRREFGGGCEDLDFFRRMMKEGRTFVWCDEAVVNEIVPPARWTRRYIIRRALLRGQNGCQFGNFVGVLKSIIALPLYAILLPFLFVAGHHLFVRYLMKIGDHAGKLLGLAGMRIMGNKYVTG
jgi:glycosyltransferase involved in cell wall biosynthesis